jgi:hypothetical protein
MFYTYYYRPITHIVVVVHWIFCCYETVPFLTSSASFTNFLDTKSSVLIRNNKRPEPGPEHIVHPEGDDDSLLFGHASDTRLLDARSVVTLVPLPLNDPDGVLDFT